MANRAFPFFGSSLKADKKEDNHRKPGAGAAGVFALSGSNRGLNLVPFFCVRQPGRAFDKVGTYPASGRPPYSRFPMDFQKSGSVTGRGKCMEDLS